MRNQDTSIGLTFLRKTFDYGPDGLLAEGHGEEGDPGGPLRFKLYQNTPHYALEQILPLTPGDARRSYELYSHQLDLTQLSTLLYYTYGFSRHDRGWDVGWPYHRFVASARCFFPVELYLWLPTQVGYIPAGYYHYDPLHHRLALLRRNEHGSELSRILGADLDSTVGVLLLSALFWKNAFRYYNFSYRLSTQEAGLVAGNALLVADTLGLQGHIHYQFLDQPANQLLGFESCEESLLAALPLYPGQRDLQRLAESATADSLLHDIAPITAAYMKRGELDRVRCASLIELDQHSFLSCTGEFVTDPAFEQPVCLPIEERLVPPSSPFDTIELAQTLHARNSGDIFFAPLPLPLDQVLFWEIVRFAMAPYASDLHCSPTCPFLQLYIVVNHIAGLDEGVYRFCVLCGRLHIIERGNFSRQLQDAYTQFAVNCTSANMVCYIVGDCQAASALLGNRSYRILHMESGLIAQRICVMSASHGLVARCSDSYHIEKCQALLHLTGSPALPLFQIVIGRERPGARYRQSLLL